MPARTPIYQLEITLEESHPPIWRRILVPANLTLDKLHDALQWVMGWEDAHLHQFISKRLLKKHLASSRGSQ